VSGWPCEVDVPPARPDGESQFRAARSESRKKTRALAVKIRAGRTLNGLLAPSVVRRWASIATLSAPDLRLSSWQLSSFQEIVQTGWGAGVLSRRSLPAIEEQEPGSGRGEWLGLRQLRATYPAPFFDRRLRTMAPPEDGSPWFLGPFRLGRRP